LGKRNFSCSSASLSVSQSRCACVRVLSEGDVAPRDASQPVTFLGQVCRGVSLALLYFVIHLCAPQVSLDSGEIGEAVKKAETKLSAPILARFYDCGGTSLGYPRERDFRSVIIHFISFTCLRARRVPDGQRTVFHSALRHCVGV